MVSTGSLLALVVGMSLLPADGVKKLPVERDGFLYDNPEKHYTWGEEIGRGKSSVVRKATSKADGKAYAAKLIYYDQDSLTYAVREYDNMVAMKKAGLGSEQGIPELHEAYLVRSYLVLIMELAEGQPLLDYAASKDVFTENDARQLVKRLVEILGQLHAEKYVHLDLRPSNIRFQEGQGMRLLGFSAMQSAGRVCDLVGDTEFVAPEVLSYKPVQPSSDMFVVGELLYTLLTGVSPFYYEDDTKVDQTVKDARYDDRYSGVAAPSSEAQDLIKKLLVKSPEDRPTAAAALQEKWFSASLNGELGKDTLKETDERLKSEAQEEATEALCVLRTFDETACEEQFPEGSDYDYDHDYDRLVEVSSSPMPGASAGFPIAGLAGVAGLFILAVVWRRGAASGASAEEVELE